jgi:hypothetical protein
MMATAKRATPEWLRKSWEQKKNDTATRVRAAVDALRQDKQAITYESIRGQIKVTYGITISANTIRRNEGAYEIYEANRAPPKPAGQRRSPHLNAMLRDGATEQDRRAVRSKISRLRRETKDTLIARLITLERAVVKQRTVENLLREEILRLSRTS